MKKIIAFTLAAVLLIGLSATGYAANDAAKLSLSAASKEVRPGESVKITVSLSDSAEAKSVALIFDYDVSSTFTVVGGQWLLSGSTISDFDLKTSPCGIAAIAFGSQTNINGNIFELNLKVNDTAAVGDKQITVSPVIMNGTQTIQCADASVKLTVLSAECSHIDLTSVAAKDSTCKEQGWDAYYKCGDCGQLFASDGVTEIDEVPFRPLGNHSGGTATCNQLAVCSVCGKSYGSYGAHNYNAKTQSTETLKSPATCTVKAVYYYSCSCCGVCEHNDAHTFEAGSYISHNYTYEVTVEPTTSDTGLLSGTCSGCKGTATITLPKLNTVDYTYKVTKEASCTEDGSANYTWNTTTYGTFDFTVTLVKLGHSFEDGECIRCHIADPDYCPQSKFIDAVPEEHWAHDSIDYVLEHGIMYGTSDNTFEPNGTVTRAMVVNMLYNLAGEPAHSGENKFTDVPADAWYVDAVLWASENKIVSGKGDGIFDPNGNITREQLAIMMQNYAKYIGKDTSASEGLDKFEDADTVSSWATDAVKWACANKIVSGSSDGGKLYLDPQGNAIRAQIAVIFENFCKKFEI